MANRQLSILVDYEMFERMRPFLEKDQRSFSAWVRLSMARYVHEQENLRDGKTQVDISAFKRSSK
jgi:hypothetical protein